MRIVITTPTGNVGNVVARRLLESDAEVVLLARDAAKVADLVSQGAQTLEGSLDDQAFVLDATRGADALFWLTPPAFVDDYPEVQRHLGKVAAAAIKDNDIPRVVHLSSAGAQNAEGNGPVDGLHAIEAMLDEVATNITHLRAGYFMENFLHHVGSIAQAGSIFMPVDPEVRIPMVSTRDIGTVAAERLLDASWTGIQHLGVHGPADLSHGEAAQAIAKALGRDVSFVRVPREAATEAMLGMGLPANWVEEMLELYEGINQGTLQPAEPRTEETTTPTTLEAWAAEALKPLVDSGA